jgi:hypothetical protein
VGEGRAVADVMFVTGWRNEVTWSGENFILRSLMTFTAHPILCG